MPKAQIMGAHCFSLARGTAPKGQGAGERQLPAGGATAQVQGWQWLRSPPHPRGEARKNSRESSSRGLQGQPRRPSANPSCLFTLWETSERHWLLSEPRFPRQGNSDNCSSPWGCSGPGVSWQCGLRLSPFFLSEALWGPVELHSCPVGGGGRGCSHSHPVGSCGGQGCHLWKQTSSSAGSSAPTSWGGWTPTLRTR